MSRDTMDIDDPTEYNTPLNPLHSSPAAPMPPPTPMRGQKRSRSQFEEPEAPPIFYISLRDGEYRGWGPEPVPAVRAVHRWIANIRWAARSTLGVAGKHIVKPIQAARAYLQSRAPVKHTAVLEASNKRRKTEMPGSYPNSPVKNDAAIASPLPTIAPLKTAENGPTPPDSRPTSSHSSHSDEGGNTAPIPTIQPQPPEVIEVESPPKRRIVGRVASPTRESIRRRGKHSKRFEEAEVPVPIAQPRKYRASYKQPYEPLRVSPNAGPPKPILKKVTRDTEIESLITKAKKVIIESPEEKAVKFTYLQRKKAEERQRDIRLRLNREANEREEERAAIEEEERQARLFIEAKQEKERLRKEEEERVKAEAAAEKKRLKDEAKKQAEAEAEERRKIHEEKLAAKRASLLAECEDSIDEDLIDIAQIISTLSLDWEEKIHQAMSVKNPGHRVAVSADGAELSRRDFGSLLPQEGTTDDPSGWLNDEMVNGFLSTIVATRKDEDKYKKGRGVPTFESFSSAWYTTYKSSGMSKLQRWSKRKGITGKAMLKCHRIFFPINTGNHWMLLIISPAFRTIEFLDSLQNSAQPPKFFAIAREWLEMELGKDYKPNEWRELDSQSERQSNMNDCGVFTCFNALASAKYMPFWTVDPSRMNKARRLMAAVLMNGRLAGEFKL